MKFQQTGTRLPKTKKEGETKCHNGPLFLYSCNVYLLIRHTGTEGKDKCRKSAGEAGYLLSRPGAAYASL